MAKNETLPFGIVAVKPDAVPDASRKNNRDDERWNFLKDFLNTVDPGQWFMVKTFDTVLGAGQKSGQINNGNNKLFPQNEYEARHESHKEKGTSDLYLSRRA